MADSKIPEDWNILNIAPSEQWKEKQCRKQERLRKDDQGNVYGYSDRGGGAALSYDILSYN